MKMLKADEVDGRTYVDLADARARIGRFNEDVYNADRLHSALGDKSPIALEAELQKNAVPDRTTTNALSPNERVSLMGRSPIWRPRHARHAMVATLARSSLLSGPAQAPTVLALGEPPARSPGGHPTVFCVASP